METGIQLSKVTGYGSDDRALIPSRCSRYFLCHHI